MTSQDRTLPCFQSENQHFSTRQGEISVGSASGEQDEERQCCACAWQEAPPARRSRDRVTGASFLPGKRCYIRQRSSHRILASLYFALGGSSSRLLASAPISAASPGLAPGRNGRSPRGAPCHLGSPCLCRERAGTPSLSAAGAGAGAGAAPARGGGSAGYRLLSLPAHPPEGWPRHRLEPQPLPFAPALPLSLPRPHLSSKTAGAATALLHSLRRQRRSGAGTARGGSGPPAMAGVRARR